MCALKIVTDKNISFKDRVEAGRILAGELKEYSGRSAVVLGIPRGGMIVAREVANILNADLDVVIARKIGAPGNPELAIGSIAEDGKLFLDNVLAAATGAGAEYINQEKQKQLDEINRRIKAYRKILPKTSLKGRTVIITDDGVATGATMQASLWSVRRENPGKLISAIPVGAGETLARMARDADDVICLNAPAFFAAVGQFYADFSQTSDEEVLGILEEESKKRKGG